MSDKGVCRTAPSTPGLLLIFNFVVYQKKNCVQGIMAMFILIQLKTN